MSDDKKNRTMLFITGASLGLVLGGCIVYFTVNTNIVRYPLEVSQNTIKSIVNEVMETLSLKKDSAETGEKAPKNVYIKKNNQTLGDTLKEEKGADTLKVQRFVSTDSLQTDITEADSSMGAVEEFQVKKDALQEIKVVEVLNLTAENNSNAQNDSLLSKVSGIQISAVPRKMNFTVEFWTSPINYKGYKLGKNKLVVYGIAPEEFYKMVMLESNYYLHYGNSYVKLVVNNNFRSFEKINDPAIMALLN